MTYNPRIDAKITDACDRLSERLTRAEAVNARVRARLDAEIAEREIQAREQKTRLQAKADGLYSRWAEAPPIPLSEETPRQYRRRLFRDMASHLPRGHELSPFRNPNLSRLKGEAFDNFEKQVHADFAESYRDPLTVSADGERVLQVTDPQTGQHSTTFVRRSSFIHDLVQPCRRVIGGLLTEARGRGGRPFDKESYSLRRDY